MPVTVAPSPGSDLGESRLPIDPRIRQRRIRVRRDEGRRRLKIVGIVVTVLLITGVVVGIAQSPLLAVHHVEVTGSAHTSRDAVVAATGLGHRALMVDVHPGRVARRLAALPWVATAAVSRRWPTTVRIQVGERTPVAAVGAGPGRLAEVDESGRVLASGPVPTVLPASPGRPPASPAGAPVARPPFVGADGPWPLPVIEGLAPAGPPGSVVGDGHALDALAVVVAVNRGLPSALSARLTTVTMAADGQVTAVMLPSVTIRVGPASQLDAKVLALRTLLERVDLRGVVTLDLRVPDVPVLTRPEPPTTVSTTPRG